LKVISAIANLSQSNISENIAVSKMRLMTNRQEVKVI